MATTKPKLEKLRQTCTRCEEPIPHEKRSDAIYCGERCRKAAEKFRYVRRNPEYVKRQRALVKEYWADPVFVKRERRRAQDKYHTEVYGHTEYIDMPIGNKNDRYRVARQLGFRSGLEVKIAKQLTDLGVPFKYEEMKIKYQVDEVRTYTPDYELSNGIVIESKGRFVSADRKKHLLIQKQYPKLDLRFVFANSSGKINKGSKTSYAMWCDKYGFKYADKFIPEEWIEE
jgi:hypothetical protein